MLCKTLRRISIFLIILSFLVPPAPCLAQNNAGRDAVWEKTFELYREIPCLTGEEIEFGAEVIAGLGYNSSRAFRQFCMMEGISFAKSKEAWSLLIGLGLSYEQILSFEAWSGIKQVPVDLGLLALATIRQLSYEAGKTFRRYCALPQVSPEHVLNAAPLLNRLTDSQNRAVAQLLALPGVTPEQALDGLGTIARFSYYQALALEALATIPGMPLATALDSLPLIRMLNMENAWNARSLFGLKAMTPEKAWFWLVAYFANPTPIQEEQFLTLDGSDRATLVHSFYAGGEELVWKINNLHGVTDRFGLEISDHTLRNSSDERINQLFEPLSPQIKSDFGGRFYGTGSKNNRISILKEAIAAERKATARRLASANIYALLAQGSELYDSSFRNILAPVLKGEIDKNHRGNLLAFLKTVDPGNQLVSNFIVSLAQKGKLTDFFPQNGREQEDILDLVAQSAFQNEDAIILFSATFMHLLEVLQPGARSFLVGRMDRLADQGNAAYSRLIAVILQYYLEEYPNLLSDVDRKVIASLLARRGSVKLTRYLAAPFAQWKEDGELASLSVFHPDDDGRDSFGSNGRMLLDSGYDLTLSDRFTVMPLTESERDSAMKLIRRAGKAPSSGLAELFWAMRDKGFAVAFVRTVNGLTINHAAYVYTDENRQKKLLQRFIRSGAEMLAQRGHSYWRSEQITEPMTELMQQGYLKDDDLLGKQRFLSLGSCGGVKAYTSLNKMFLGKVDILATIGTGLAAINDPYNKNFFEVVAKKPSTINWKDMSDNLAFIFKGGHGRDYLQPGSLPAILHKILDEEKTRANKSASGENRDSNTTDAPG